MRQCLQPEVRSSPAALRAMAQTVQIIVVSYETPELLEACIESLVAQGLSTNVCIVDNSNTAESRTRIQKRFPDLEVLHYGENLGYAGAINRAASGSKTDYILVLNADTVLTEGGITAALDYMQDHPDVALLGPRLEYPSGDLQPTCRRFYNMRSLLFRRTFIGRLWPHAGPLREHLMLDFDHKRPITVDWIMGAAMLIRRSAFLAVGGMDARYFLYFEDVDLCRRFRETGWHVVYNPSVTIIHHYQRQSFDRGLFNRDLWRHLFSSLKYLDRWNPELALTRLVSRHTMRMLLACWDITAPLLAFLVAYQARILTGTMLAKPLYPMENYVGFLALEIFILLFTVAASGGYTIPKDAFTSRQVSTIVTALVFTMLAFALTSIVLDNYMNTMGLSRLVVVLSLVFAVPIILGGRLLLAVIQRLLWSRRLGLTRLIFLGWSPSFAQLSKELAEDPLFGYDPLGFIDGPELDAEIPALPRLGTAHDLDAILTTHGPGEVVCTSDLLPSQVGTVLKCLQHGLVLRVVHEGARSSITDAHTDDFLGYQGQTLCWPITRDIQLCLKYLLDIVGAAILLFAHMPILLWAAWRIRREDGGPAMFRQKHWGCKGKTFGMLRFRTLATALPGSGGSTSQAPFSDAEQPDNGQRLLKIGRLLRAWNLDELPQLFNVLMGHMSLVGPRPQPLLHNDSNRRSQELRLSVKPGITGLWQVFKQREWTIDQMILLDLRYILGWSLALDFRILLNTPGAVLAKARKNRRERQRAASG